MPPATHETEVELPSIKQATHVPPASVEPQPLGAQGGPLTPLKKTQLALWVSRPSDWQLHGAERVGIACAGSLGT